MTPNSNSSLNIPRIHTPSIECFNRDYAIPGKPVLITGVVPNWRAYSLWEANYFVSIDLERKVPVKRMQNGNYVKAKTEMMKIEEYIDTVNKADVLGDERVYLSEQPVENIMPELIKDYSIPDYINAENPLAVLYVGSHVFSQIHFHPFGKAMLCVVSGRKIVRLYPPDQTPFLYQKYNFSKIDSEEVDLEKYPLYGKAKYYECEVNAGEMLFFPIYWWHGVKTEEFTSAVVFFWDDPHKLRWAAPEGISWYYPPFFEVARWVLKGKSFMNRILKP